MVLLILNLIQMLQQRQPNFELLILLQLQYGFPELEPTLPLFKENTSDHFLLQSSGVIIVGPFQ